MRAAVIPVDTARYGGTEFERQRFWRRCPDDRTTGHRPVQRAAAIPDGFGKAIEGKQTCAVLTQSRQRLCRGPAHECVKLADTAAATGLTRMHFAARLSGATGLLPHEHLSCAGGSSGLKKCSSEPSCRWWMPRYQSSSKHRRTSPTVFKRYSGQPPAEWRESVALQTRPTSA